METTSRCRRRWSRTGSVSTLSFTARTKNPLPVLLSTSCLTSYFLPRTRESLSDQPISIMILSVAPHLWSDSTSCTAARVRRCGVRSEVRLQAQIRAQKHSVVLKLFLKVKGQSTESRCTDASLHPRPHPPSGLLAIEGGLLATREVS